ncbi:MAG: hypothetical protein KF748_03950 [Xanthobacteraceae bacterium]|nr:hypothetical protein [Xanthobacteraceae bacterium]
MFDSKVFELAITAGSTLVAAFVGSWAAFKLENIRRVKDVREKNVSNANSALYTLYRMWNTLRQYQREVIEECRGKPDNWLNMTATLSGIYDNVSVNKDDISFLLATDDPQAFAEVMLENQRHSLALKLINRRSDLIFDEVFPRMSNAQIPVGAQVPIGDVERILGVSIVHQLKEHTRDIIKFVDADVASLENSFHKLRAAALALYPGEKFIKVDFKEVPKKEIASASTK